MSGAATIPLGTVVGGYRLESVLGTGGMGAVYRATHLRLGRKAAVKVLSEALSADPTYVSRFFQEARVVNEVGHPNIIDIVDFIDGEGSPKRVAYVMELVEGPPLSRVLAQRPLTTRQSLNIALQLLDALAAVHRINVIHRDLKPDNILVVGSLDTDLSDRPAIKVLDFGIAKVNDQSAQQHRTNTGMMLGTPAYMAPEQAAGESVSAGTDIYAVGEILYEMLAGARLFIGPNMKILRLKVGEIPPEVKLPENTPFRAELTAVVSACIAPEQTQRPSITQLTTELRALLAQLSGSNEIRANAVVTPAVRYTPEQAPSLYQQTLVPPLNSDFAPRRKTNLYAWAGLILMLLASAVLGGVIYQRETAPIVLSFPPKSAPPPQEEAKPEAVVENLPEPTIEKVVEPLIATEDAAVPAVSAPRKKIHRRANESPVVEEEVPAEEGPLKKGEFPTW